MKQTLFDERFSSAFKHGLTDIKFFVRRDSDVSPDALRDEALQFQLAIDESRFTRVDAVD